MLISVSSHEPDDTNDLNKKRMTDGQKGKGRPANTTDVIFKDTGIIIDINLR